MPVTHTNFKGQNYYLHAGWTKKGAPRYYFSMKKGIDLAESIPEGYEIYENPNGMVFLRKIQPRFIQDEEIGIVEREIRKQKHLKHIKVDVKKKAIIVYEPDRDEDEMIAIASIFNPKMSRGDILRGMTYSPKLQFVLIDAEKRLFEAQRWCLLGSIDDWIEIGEIEPLDTLVKKYVKHIGKESFFDLD